MFRDGERPCMEQTTTGAQRPAAIVPCEVGVAGPEAAPARSGSEAPDRLWGATTQIGYPYRNARITEPASTTTRSESAGAR